MNLIEIKSYLKILQENLRLCIKIKYARKLLLGTGQ